METDPNVGLFTTVFVTVISGILTYLLGQIALKMFIEPVDALKKTIGAISHSLIENHPIISNSSVLPKDVIEKTSSHLKSLSGQLHNHIYLIPCFNRTAWLFRLPTRDNILTASKQLDTLSKSIFPSSSDDIYERNAKSIEKICDSLGIYWPNENRWPKD